MAYFNYHAAAKQLIADGKLTGFVYTGRHNRISPALVLLFDDARRPAMPIRSGHWREYEPLLPPKKRIIILYRSIKADSPAP